MIEDSVIMRGNLNQRQLLSPDTGNSIFFAVERKCFFKTETFPTFKFHWMSRYWLACRRRGQGRASRSKCQTSCASSYRRTCSCSSVSFWSAGREDSAGKQWQEFQWKGKSSRWLFSELKQLSQLNLFRFLAEVTEDFFFLPFQRWAPGDCCGLEWGRIGRIQTNPCWG